MLSCKNLLYLQVILAFDLVINVIIMIDHQDCQIVHDGGCSHCQRCKAQPSAFTQWGQINHCYIARRALLDYVAGLYCRTIVYVDQALLHCKTSSKINHCYIARRALLDYVAGLYVVELYRRTIVQINHCYIATRALQDYVAGLYCRTIV